MTEKIEIDGARALKLLADRVEGWEHHVYENAHGACRYVREGRSDCLVGQVLEAAGMTVEELAELDASDNPGIADAELPERVTLSEEARAAFAAAQLAQDSGHCWGVALDDARGVVSE